MESKRRERKEEHGLGLNGCRSAVVTVAETENLSWKVGNVDNHLSKAGWCLVFIDVPRELEW